ncbi:uncharacterized protein jcada [Synchiropus splendidus]|uniref:uncharacterized protein jcada n=1 Tax=Synchiropus splendidus TaxID=270530 RepID=UPI00237D83C1|nr:uncharacterized protein jcada [Synchiropus splendidus]XP_053716342.1 uncharacterized protein jcada [Synchiropus splendidus]
MYSVEDLLISHGYKLPKHTASTSATPTPAPAPSSRRAPSSSPPAYTKHHEIVENRPRTVNGYERGSRVTYGNAGGSRQPQAYSGGSSCPNNNNAEPRDRSQSRQEAGSRNQLDTHSFGESLTSDSGFCDGAKSQQTLPKDMSYWRRRGQDFNVLLDYSDLKEAKGGGQAGVSRTERPQQARGQEMSAEERQRAVHERQRWAAQAQVQAQAEARSRDREAALNQWRMANERKCQSLGNDDWHPAVTFRQLSQNERERWAQEQQRLLARTPDGMVVHPRTKAKSQSLPRMVHPDSLHYVDIPSSGQELYRRGNGQPQSLQDFYRHIRWPENGRPASANPFLTTPKPRFTRPPRPPSYEMHQQIRGSCEVLSGRDSVVSHARDRTPIPISNAADTQLDYFAQNSGPPGYIPPPSYKRVPVIVGGRRGYSEIAVDYRYRGDVYQQIHVAPDGSRWYTRHPAVSWHDPQRERLSGQKQLYPVYTSQEHPGGGIQYIPFDDPRIRHISSALGDNSLTDADKIRHIRNELPSVTVSEPASENSAFLPPPMGPFISAKLADDASQMSSRLFDNDNGRWHSNLHKEIVDNFPATDQNCNNRYSKNQRPPPSPSSSFQVSKTASRPGSTIHFAETITQVKTILPESGTEIHRNSKRRVSETIFCLVSVPVHTPTNINKDSDQNNNETPSSLTLTSTDTFAVGLKETHKVRSKSVNEMPIKHHYSHYHTTSTNSMRNYKRAPLRKEIIDAWALQASKEKELCNARSWPGNQYRNQETQTGSPLVKSPELQSPSEGPELAQSSSDTTTDSGLGADQSSLYGYPMTGQKNLHPSSNSAFSRLSVSPIESPSSSPLQTALSTYEAQDQEEPKPSSPKKNSPTSEDTAEQSFGQFLLKPVNRRPCDAIGELESINKEMDDMISKRPILVRSFDDLDGMKNRRKAHFRDGPEPGREAISLPHILTEKPSIKVRSKSFTSANDLDCMRSSVTSMNGICNDLKENGPLSTLPHQNEMNCHYRQDIPVPQESLLKDVGLTVYTETPGGPGEPLQRSLSVPSPLVHMDLSQHGETKKVLVVNGSSSEHKLNEGPHVVAGKGRKEKFDFVTKSQSMKELNSVCLKRRDDIRSPQSDSFLSVTRTKKQLTFVFDDDSDERYAISKRLTYKNDSTIADKHLENLLNQEKAGAVPTEDLSNLYEVQSAQGIPENESIEQRAARILGIAVPVGALGGDDKQSDGKEETQQVSGCEEVEGKGKVAGVEKTVEQTGLAVDPKEGERQKHRSSISYCKGNVDPETKVSLDQSDFSPTKLAPTIQVNPKDKRTLDILGGEKKGHGHGKLIESLQDKLCSSSSMSRGNSTPGRMARLKELDSVSRIRQLSLNGLESKTKLEAQIIGAQEVAKLVIQNADMDVFKENSASSFENEHETQEGKTDFKTEARGEVEGEKGGEGDQREELMGQKGISSVLMEKACDIKTDLGTDSEVEQTEANLESNVDETEVSPHLPKAEGAIHSSVDRETENSPEVRTEVTPQLTDGISEESPETVEINEIESRGTEMTSSDVKPTDVSLDTTNAKETEVSMEIKLDRSEVKGIEITTDSKIRATDVKTNSTKVRKSEATKDSKGQIMPKAKRRTKLQKPPLLPKPRSVPKREITLPLSFSSGTCDTSHVENDEMPPVSDAYDPSRVERV